MSCNESQIENCHQQHWWCDRFPEDIQEPAFLSEVMEADVVLNSSDFDENESEPCKPERRGHCFLNPSLENKQPRLRLNSDPTTERTQKGQASVSFPRFHPIDSSQNEMKYLPNNEKQKAQDGEVIFLRETSMMASDMIQPNAVIDILQQNKQNEMIDQHEEQKWYNSDNSRRDSFFDEVVCASNDDIDPFEVDDAECHSQRFLPSECSRSNATTRGVTFDADGKNSVTPAQQNEAEALDKRTTNEALSHDCIHIKKAPQKRQGKTHEVNIEEVLEGGSLASSFTSLSEDIDFQDFQW